MDELHVKKLEQAAVNISIKLADIAKSMQAAKELSAGAEETLTQAQLELEELYVQLLPTV